MIPIYDREFYGVSITIKPSYISEFLEKYIINDCPNGTLIEFKEYNTSFLYAAFIMENGHFRLDENYSDMDTYKFLFGVSEQSFKVEEELNYFVKNEMHTSVTTKLNALFKEKPINVHDMHSLILNKFKFMMYTTITLTIDHNSFHVNVCDEDEVIDEKLLGYLSLVKLTGEETCEMNNENVVKDIYEYFSKFFLNKPKY